MSTGIIGTWWKSKGFPRVVVPIKQDGRQVGYAVEVRRRGLCFGRVAIVWKTTVWSWWETKAFAREIARHPIKLSWAADGRRIRDLRESPRAFDIAFPRRPASLDQIYERRLRRMYAAVAVVDRAYGRVRKGYGKFTTTFDRRRQPRRHAA